MGLTGPWLWFLLWVLAVAGIGKAWADTATTAAGLAWLQGRVVSDGSLLGEAEGPVSPIQGRADAAITLVFGEVPAPALLAGLDTPPDPAEPTESLARRLLALGLGGTGDGDSLAQALAARQNGDGGFGAAPGWPSTPLDTAWAAWAQGVHDPASPAAARALDFLDGQIQPDGGLAGISATERIQSTALAIFAVTAQSRSAAALTTLETLSGWLLRQQAADGIWQQDLYLTALSLAALTPQVADPAWLAGGRQFLLASQRADGSWAGDPFLTAWALRALLPQRSAPEPDPSLASLSGRLLDADTGLPLAGAAIVLGGPHNLTVRSGPDGRFSRASLPAGSYGFTAALAGYRDYTASYRIAAGQSVDLGDIPLPALPTAGLVHGRVTAAATGQPLAGVPVRCSGSLDRTVLTDASGRFELAGVPPGDLTLTANLPGYGPATGTIAIAAGETLLFSPALYALTDPAPPATGHLLGTVVDAATGAPLAAVPIEIDGVVLAATGADGGFHIELAPAAHVYRIAGNGYRPLTGSFLLTAGSLADAGRLALVAPRTQSTLTGRVTDLRTGNAIAGARVELLGLSAATTDRNGEYRFAALAGNSLDLRVTATGYTGQLWQLALNAPGDLIRDFSLDASAALAVALDPLAIAPAGAGPDSEMVIRTQARSEDNQTLSLVSSLQIVDTEGQGVGTAPATDTAGHLVGTFTLAPGQQRELLFRWNTGQFPPGDYRPIARLSEAGTISARTLLGRVVAEQAGTLAVTAGNRLSGTLTADPPVLKAGTAIPVKLSSVLRNAGNLPWPVRRYRLEAVQVQNGTRTLLQEQAAGPLAVGALMDLAWADWTPAEPGDYRLELTAADSPSEGTVTAQVYVGEAATGRFSLDRRVVPKGNQTVHATIDLSGTDAVTGAVSDPLAPLIRQAVRKAVDYNDPHAADWTLSNRCLGCHIQAQALVGGELNRGRAAFDPAQRNTLLNALTQLQQADGSFGTDPNFHRTPSILGLWALDSWHDQGEIGLTLIRAADYLVAQQDAGGSWTPDHASGWWSGRPANTAVTLKSLVDIRGLLSSAPGGSLKTYARSPWIAGQGLSGTYFLASDGDGNVYASNYYAGSVVRIRPDGTVEPWIASLPVSSQGIAVAADGTTYVGSPSAIYRRDPGGSLSILAARRGDGLVLGPDGDLYVSDYAANRILRITPDGQVSEHLAGGGLNGPQGLAFTESGELLVANYNDQKILGIKPDRTVETMVAWTHGNPRGLVRHGDGWLVGTTNGLYRYNAGWRGERLSFEAAQGVTVTADGRIITGDGWITLHDNRPEPLETASRLAALDTAIARAAAWLLDDAHVDAGSNLDVAFRLLGLGAARAYYEGQPLADTLFAKMREADALLRSRQHPDGGWGRAEGAENWGGDAMVTAMVGLALDALSPSPTDPVIREAIQWLLNTQSADGSWTSQNGILSTRLAATTWVAIWLPVALDRIAGIDTDLSLALPGNITLANPTVAPTATAANAHGGTTYTWALTGVTRTGLSLGFDLAFRNLALGESRPAAKAATLGFLNGFTGQPLTAPLAIPEVEASAFLGLTVGTDRLVYGENEAVTIAVPVSNLGPLPADASVGLAIESADGLHVAGLGTLPATALQSGETRTLRATWTTGTAYPGGYRVVATLLDGDGETAGRAVAGFTLVAGSVAGGAGLDGAVHTDRAEYPPTASVLISGRVRGLAGNGILEGLTLTERVLAPDGAEIFRAGQPLPQVLGQALATRDFTLPLIRAAAGTYTVEQTVADARGTILDRRGAGFTVQSTATTGSGLVGSFAALPETLPAGASLDLAYRLANRGNAAVAGAEAVLRLLDPVAGTLAGEWRRPLDLAPDGTAEDTRTLSTLGLATGQPYLLALAVDMDGRERLLGQATFRLAAPPPPDPPPGGGNTGSTGTGTGNTGDTGETGKGSDPGDGQPVSGGAVPREITGNAPPLGRVLVALDPREARWPCPKKAPRCPASRRHRIEEALTGLGREFRIVTGRAAFRREFRSGRYAIIWLAGGGAQRPGGVLPRLGRRLERELKEAVYRGTGLVIDGRRRRERPLLERLAGVRRSGVLRPRHQAVSFAQGPLAGETLRSPGPALRLQRRGGTVLARFPRRRPAAVGRGHGAGHALRFGFDLARNLGAGGAAAWRERLGQALAYACPLPPAALSADLAGLARDFRSALPALRKGEAAWQRRALARLRRARLAANRGRWEIVLMQLLQASSAVTHLRHPDAPAWRRRLADALADYEYRAFLRETSAQPSPASVNPGVPRP